MSIIRGVSLYSLQEDYYLGKLDLEGCIAKTVNEIGAKGIEVIFKEMPLPSMHSISREVSDEDVALFKGWMEKYGAIPTSYGAGMLNTMYSNRHLTEKELTYWVAKDLKNAAKLGFKVYRGGIMNQTDMAAYVNNFELCEELGIQITTEIHSPRGIHTWWTQDFIENIEKKNAKQAGFVIDFGIFTVGMATSKKKRLLRDGATEKIVEAIDMAYRAKAPLTEEDVRKMGGNEVDVLAAKQMSAWIYDDPQWIKEILPYVRHCHGKFYEMTEDCVEPAIDYEGPLTVLKEAGWSGSISSEYEGQREYFDLGCDIYVDPVEQCRRHHVMLKRILGE